MNMQIKGTGSSLPANVLTNDDLAKYVETSDEWIKERTGIEKRHISTGETVASLASKACIKALADAGKSAEDVDLILVATCSPEMALPCVACQVQDAIGAVNAVAFDLNAACAGFLFALHTAHSYMAAGIYKNALVVGAEVLFCLFSGFRAIFCSFHLPYFLRLFHHYTLVLQFQSKHGQNQYTLFLGELLLLLCQ